MFLAAEPVGLALSAQPVRAGNAIHLDTSALKGNAVKPFDWGKTRVSQYWRI
jgi:hypothetical protein